MKRTHLFVACLFVLSLTVVPCSAFAFIGLDVGVGYWSQTPSGTLRYQPVAGTIGDIDLKDDLNMDTENKPFVRVKAELPLILPNVYFLATPMSFEQTGRPTRDISFGNVTFNVSVPVESKITLDHYDLALFYPIPLLKTATLGKLNVELGLNARQLNFEATLTGGGQTASKSLTVYVPMIYAGVQVKPISLFSIEAEARGISISGNSYYDYIGRLKVHPVPLAYIAAGYRTETIKLDVEDIVADIKFSGPFAEVGLSF
jgi:outer membrane protein